MDKITVAKGIPTYNVVSIAFGATEIVDNHGNHASGLSVRCADGRHLQLDAHSWDQLYNAVRGFLIMQRVADEGFPTGPVRSPIQSICKAR